MTGITYNLTDGFQGTTIKDHQNVQDSVQPNQLRVLKKFEAAIKKLCKKQPSVCATIENQGYSLKITFSKETEGNANSATSAHPLSTTFTISADGSVFVKPENSTYRLYAKKKSAHTRNANLAELERKMYTSVGLTCEA